MKTLRTLLIAAALVCSAMLFVACGGSKEKDYKVTVKDSLGNVYSGVVVQFLQEGNQVALVPVDETGVATKTLPTGDYTVALRFTGDAEGYYYDTEGLTLSKDKTELEVILSNKVTADTPFRTLGIGEETHDAYQVEPGCTYVKLNDGYRTYFVFTPTEPGLYEIGVVDNATAEVGYYGAPHYVQQNSAADVVDNKFTMNIKAGNIGTEEGGTTVIVIGLDSKDGAKNTILTINRVSDPIFSIEDEPWTVYQPTSVLSPWEVGDDVELVDFDLTADGYTLVYNEFDGFYHLNEEDGPLVYMYLTVSSGYLDPLSVVAEKSSVSKYFYDEDGNFVKKESYNECLNAYIACADENYGVYPLTDDLIYIIQQRGDHYGWFNSDNKDTYLFRDLNGNLDMSINLDIAWLFPCCYEAE